MSAKIQELIDKRDNFELIRDELAAILLVEVASQKVLAVTAAKNPDLWDINIFSEASRPWELIEDVNGQITNETPIANIQFDQMSFVENSMNLIEGQQANGKFNIDVLGAKVHRQENAIGDIIAGDQLAALECQRIVRLVRNILMASIYTYIFTDIDADSGLPIAVKGIVQERKFSSIDIFVPQINDRPAQHVVGARMQMSVKFIETGPEIDGPIMELVSTQTTRSSDGLIYFTADIETT